MLTIATSAKANAQLLGTHYGSAFSAPVTNISVSRLAFDGTPARAAQLDHLFLSISGGASGVAGETTAPSAKISITDCVFRNSSGNNVVRIGDASAFPLNPSGLLDFTLLQ